MFYVLYTYIFLNSPTPTKHKTQNTKHKTQNTKHKKIEQAETVKNNRYNSHKRTT